MIKPKDPRELAESILTRSTCSVMVGAAIEDPAGRIHSWGWNSVGEGFGLHAEAHAILRANKKRLKGSTIYVAGLRRRNSKVVGSRPCPDCLALIRAYSLSVWYRDGTGKWVKEMRA